MPKKYTKEQFIEKAKEIHNNKYDYSKVEYINNSTKVCIICPEHGEFWQRPHDHLRGHGCPVCANNKNLTTEEFIKRSNIAHNNKYDYSKSKYINNLTSIKIICPEHGLFEQKPIYHLDGHGCPYCVGKQKTNSMFIKELEKIHGDKYNYNKVDYVGNKKKVCVVCNKCGQEFWQRPNDLLNGHGCPKCSASKGEEKISKFLKEKNIKFIYNKACLDFLGKLKPDFYLPDYNLIIEYDGRQHFKPVDLFGGNEEFLKTQERDKLKNKLCEEHNIKLVRISYTQFNEIEEIIDSIIC